MADDEKGKKEGGEGESTSAPPASGGKKKLMLIIGGVVFLLIAAGVPVVLFTTREKPIENAELAADAADGGVHEAGDVHAEGADDEEQLEEGEEAMGALFPLETFVVNLSGGHYIRVQLQIEFEEREIPRRFYNKLVPVRDGIIGLLAGRTSTDLESQKGRDQLKNDVKELINEVLRKQEVKRVYFTQFVIQ